MDTPDLVRVQRAVGARYEVLDLVGAGGMGVVFRARHRELGNMVAIKVLPPEVAESRIREERFRREAQLAAHLSHPNVVPVYEFDSVEGLTFLIMPFVRGRTLENLLAERPRLPLPELLRVLTDVGAALDFAHARGVVHRDVKPANILIEEETSRALLADFGIALARVSAAGSLTAPGSAIGTPAYMAPEQLSGAERVNGSADLYALALVAYEALTGDLPNAGLDRAALATALHQRRRDVTPSAAAALVAPLVDQPLERPASATAWLLGVGRASGRPWRRVAASLVALLLVGGVVGLVLSRRGAGAATQHGLAVMPFTMLGTDPQLPPAQLPAWFLQRLGSVPQLSVVPAASVAQYTEGKALGISEAQSLALQLDAKYFVQPRLRLQGTQARLGAQLYQTRGSRLLAEFDTAGSSDSLEQLMDAVWDRVLPPIVRGNFAPVSNVTLPHGLVALRAYAEAEEAFRRGDFATALEDYTKVLTADSTFAIGYFRRALVVAQVDPREASIRGALAGARGHQSGLTPADSLLLEGYRLLLERGDGRAALQRFKEARDQAPDQPQVWFVLGEFYYHFGELFDEHVLDADEAFSTVLDSAPNFAPAIAHLASLKYMKNDMGRFRSLIEQYEAFGTSSVVAEAIGIADTLVLHGVGAQAELLKTLGNHTFTALQYLAYQAEEFGNSTDRRGPGRAILRALERKATTDSQLVLALRLGVAADLGEGWSDSARARLARVHTPATERERDMWLVLLPAVGLEQLGPWKDAAGRLDRSLAPSRGGGEIVHWMLARLKQDEARHVAALDRLVAKTDSAPLALSLHLDLEAQRALARGDSGRALELWQQATHRYAVLRVPFDLAASLWWLRRDLARVARAQRDTALAEHTCESFTALIGYIDLLVRPDKDKFCPPGGVAGP